MWEIVRQNLDKILEEHEWATELAGILPLSALIDFIDVPKKLHILQLTGKVPLWSWAITPAAGRLLFAPESSPNCVLDCHGNSQSLQCIDGRYGDQYFAANPETLRLCLEAEHSTPLPNKHPNMQGKHFQKRPQWLQIVHVTHSDRKPAHLYLYSLANASGWIFMLVGMIVASLLRLHLALGFLLAIISAGAIVHWMHGRNPRRLLVDSGNDDRRIILGASHMNETRWYLFVGDSIKLNSLLNRALTSDARHASQDSKLLRLALRVLIGGQWACALGAAATKNWNAYLITFFIIFCIVSHSYLFPPSVAAKCWLKCPAHLQLRQFEIELSSRRALLNTILAFNPDSFEGQRTENFRQDGLKILDPILNPTQSRIIWEAATLAAIDELYNKPGAALTPREICMDSLSQEWQDKYKTQYWAKFILEGIHVAAIIRQALDAET